MMPGESPADEFKSHLVKFLKIKGIIDQTEKDINNPFTSPEDAKRLSEKLQNLEQQKLDEDSKVLKKFGVSIDKEIKSGKTTLDIHMGIAKQFPQKEQSILDERSKQQHLEKTMSYHGNSPHPTDEKLEAQKKETTEQKERNKKEQEELDDKSAYEQQYKDATERFHKRQERQFKRDFRFLDKGHEPER